MAKELTKIVATSTNKIPAVQPIQQVEKLGRTISKPVDIKTIKGK